MVQQISALIVQPAVDASKYTAGASEKVAADKAMAASSREAGAAVVDMSAKISPAGDVLARLSRQFVDGYANEQRFNQGLNQLSRGLESGKISMEGAERILVGMNQRLGLTADVSQVAAKGQMTLATAVERANAQIARQAVELANADTVSRRLQPANSNVISAGQRQAAGFNAGQQLQDIGMMALTGQNVGVLALQQGPQLATAIQQGGGLGTVVSGLGSLLSLTTLLTIGFTAAGAAAIQWFVKGKDGAKELEEKLKGHSATLSRLKQQYGELGDASKNIGGPVGGAAYTEAQARSEIDTIRAAIRSQSGDLSKEFIGGGFLRGGLFGSKTGGLDALLSTKNSPFQGAVDDLLKSIRDGNGGLEKFDANLNKIFDDLRGKSSDPAKLAEEMQRLSDAALDAFSVTGKMSPFQGEIDRLLLGLKEGNGDLSTFASNVRHIGELNGIEKQADDAILAAKEVVNLAEKLKEVEQVLRRIDQENTRPGLRDQRDLQRYVAGRNADARILDQQFAADQQLSRARTNAERMAAVEAQVRARAKEDGDSGGGLQARVNRALSEERTRQEVEARDAAIQRSQAIANSLQQQRLELDLIGKTTGEQTKLTYEFERMQELREQSARTGEPVDEKEVANIKAAAAAMGMYADALTRAKLNNDLQFEREQLFRSPNEQAIAARLRGTGIGLNSPEAQKMRDIQTFGEAKESASNFARTFGQEMVNSGGNIGKSMGKAIESSLLDATQKAWERLADQVGTAFANWLTSGNSAGAGGSAFGTATGVAEMLFGGKGAANDNFAAPLGTVTRAPLANIGSSVGAAQSLLGKLQVGKPSSYITGMSSEMQSGLAAMFAAAPGSVQSATSIMSGARSVERQAQLWEQALAKYGSPSIARRWVAPPGHSQHNFGNAADLTFGSPEARNWFHQNASQYGMKFPLGNEPWHIETAGARGALDKLANSANAATKDLGTFGGGLGKLGGALNQFPAAPGGGSGSLLGGLGGLLGGGLSSAFSGTKAFSWLSANPGGYIGLFDSGGSILNGNVVPFGPKTRSLGRGVLADSGFGPGHFPAILEEGESVLSRNMMGRTMRALKGAANQNADSGSSGPAFHFNIDARGSTMTRAEYEQISRQQAQAALAEYQRTQVRGGFGQTNQKYASYKG